MVPLGNSPVYSSVTVETSVMVYSGVTVVRTMLITVAQLSE